MDNTLYGGGYIIDNKDVSTYVYTKATNEQMKQALPLTYDAKSYDEGKQYLVCIIKDIDYIGMMSYDDIKNTLNNLNSIDILNTDYKDMPEIISQEMYNNTKQFVLEQIKECKYINT
jgi:hypothetical protein